MCERDRQGLKKVVLSDIRHHGSSGEVEQDLEQKEYKLRVKVQAILVWSFS